MIWYLPHLYQLSVKIFLISDIYRYEHSLTGDESSDC